MNGSVTLAYNAFPRNQGSFIEKLKKKTSLRSIGSETQDVINTMQEPCLGSQLGDRQKSKWCIEDELQQSIWIVEKFYVFLQEN